MPRQSPSAATGQQPEAIVQARGYLPDSNRGGACSRKLDSERDAVQPPADGSNRCKDLVLRRKARVPRHCSRDEQLNGTVSKHVIRTCQMLPRYIQRCNAIDIFALYPENLSAGCKHRYLRTYVQERFCQLSNRVDDMLAIIEQQ